MSNPSILEKAESAIKGKNLTIVFPEGKDPRILGAAIRHKNDGILNPIVLGDKGKIQKVADENDLKLGDLQIVDPEYDENFSKLVYLFVEVRKGKARNRVCLKYRCKENF